MKRDIIKVILNGQIDESGDYKFESNGPQLSGDFIIEIAKSVKEDANNIDAWRLSISDDFIIIETTIYYDDGHGSYTKTFKYDLNCNFVSAE